MRTVAFVFNSIPLPPRPSIRAILPFLFLRKEATIEIFNSKDLLGFYTVFRLYCLDCSNKKLYS